VLEGLYVGELCKMRHREGGSGGGHQTVCPKRFKKGSLQKIAKTGQLELQLY